MAALSSSSVFISYILITQPLVYCLRKKCKIYYSLYCTKTCIISRDESLNSVDYKLVTLDILHAATQFLTCSTVKNRPRHSNRVFVVVVILIPHQLQASLQLPQQLLLLPRQICPCVCDFG